MPAARFVTQNIAIASGLGVAALLATKTYLNQVNVRREKYYAQMKKQ